MTTYDPHASGALAFVLVPPVPDVSGHSVVVQPAGRGALFPDPALVGEYNVSVFPNGQWYLGGAGTDHGEVIRVTAHDPATDIFTIDRAQEGSTARAIITGDVFSMAPTGKTFTDIEGALFTAEGDISTLQGQMTTAQGDISDLESDTVLLAGRAGGQIVEGGTAASEALTLRSTHHATKGKIKFGTSAYDEVNNRLGIGIDNPTYTIETAKDPGNDQEVSHLIHNLHGAGGTHSDAILRLISDKYANASWLVSTGSAHIDGVGHKLILVNANTLARIELDDDGSIKIPGYLNAASLGTDASGNLIAGTAVDFGPEVHIIPAGSTAAQINASIAALGAAGGVILFCPGTYDLSTSIILPASKKISLIGLGRRSVIFKSTTGATPLLCFDPAIVWVAGAMVTSTHVTCENLVFLLDHTASQIGMFWETIFSGANFVSNLIMIKDCTFLNSYNTTNLANRGIYLRGISCIKIINCDFDNLTPAQQYGVGVYIDGQGGTPNTWVMDVVFSMCHFTSWSGIQIAGNGAGCDVEGVYVYDCHFTSMGNNVAAPDDPDNARHFCMSVNHCASLEVIGGFAGSCRCTLFTFIDCNDLKFHDYWLDAYRNSVHDTMMVYIAVAAYDATFSVDHVFFNDTNGNYAFGLYLNEAPVVKTLKGLVSFCEFQGAYWATNSPFYTSQVYGWTDYRSNRVMGQRLLDSDELFIPAGDFSLALGAAVWATVGGWPVDANCWVLHNASADGLAVQFDPDIKGRGSVQFTVVYSVPASAGLVHLDLAAAEITPFVDDMGKANTYNPAPQIVNCGGGAGALGVLMEATFAGLLAVQPGDTIRIVVDRNGPAADDTCAQDLNFYGVRLTFYPWP